MTITTKNLQRILTKASYYDGKIDGVAGPKTTTAVDAVIGTSSLYAGTQRGNVLAAQLVMAGAKVYGGQLDGLYGPKTEAAIEVFLGTKAWRKFDKPPADKSTRRWPYYRDLVSFYGEVGTNQVMLRTPYPMQLAWDTNTTVHRFSINKKCHASAARIFKNTLVYYGYEKIVEMNLHLFGGCLNVRKMRGGSKYSVHSWGAAIDMDPAENRLRMGPKRAKFAGPEYDKYFEFVKAEGWVSLGRDKGYDYMHCEALHI